MTRSSNQTKWLYQFERPAFFELARLREILADMDIIPAERKLKKLTPREELSLPVQGTLDQVMMKLSDALIEDYATNLVEQKNAPWAFDYVIGDPTPNIGAIEVLTRLFDPTDPSKGKIFYGRTIKRNSDDEYSLWIDD